MARRWPRRTSAVSADGLRVAVGRVWPWFVFAGVPIVLTVWFLVDAWHRGIFALDFHHAFWAAGRSVIEGDFAYPESIDIALGQSDPFVYPPLTALLLTPFALLPSTAADLVYTAISGASLSGGLWLLEVRDWRCYGLTLLWLPTLSALQAGNLSPLLVLGLGVLWATRGHAIRAGLAASLLGSAKLFLWPLFVWLAITRRYRAAASAFALAVVLNAAAWQLIGAGSVSHYVHIVRRLSILQGPETYTIPAFVRDLGAPSLAGSVVLWTVVAALLYSSWRRREDDAHSYGLIVIVALIASPIVWLHYLILLAVPIAVTRPTLSWPWFLPLALIVCPGKGNGTTAETLTALIVVAAVAGSCLWPRSVEDCVARGVCAIHR